MNLRRQAPLPAWNVLWAVLIVMSFTWVCSPSAHAQSEENAAFVFGYYPNDGQGSLFDEGYSRHLEWHREHEDPLPWYGWYVSSGERLGMFIDGTFGISFAAYDERVDLAEDAADAAKNISPFSRPVFRRTYVMRHDLSTGSPLEERQPSPHVQVLYYKIRPGMADAFENAVRTLRPVLQQEDEIPTHTWYELVVGGVHPSYMLLVSREEWSSYGSFRETIASAVAEDFDSVEANNLLSTLARTVEAISSEVWSYRSDLSYLPGE